MTSDQLRCRQGCLPPEHGDLSHEALGNGFVGYGIGNGELTGVEMYITGGPMTVDVAMSLIKGDPRVVDGNPCYPDPMPDVGEAALIYGYFVDRRAEVKTGFADVNGAKLYYETAGEGDPVILIHGYGGDRRDWDYLFRPLAEQHQVVRYDLRGFGKSDRPTTEPYSHVEDLKALMETPGHREGASHRPVLRQRHWAGVRHCPS